MDFAFHAIIGGKGFVVEVAGVGNAVFIKAVFRTEEWGGGTVFVFLHPFVKIEGGKGGFGMDITLLIHHVCRAAAQHKALVVGPAFGDNEFCVIVDAGLK